MAQQPNIELEIEELPRPEPHPGPARPWRPGRPGELLHPEDVPHGGLFGTPGPDAGYALTLIDEVGPELPEGEHRPDTVAALATVMIARASAEGRAPTVGDLDAAATLLGIVGVPDEVAEAFAAYRRRRFAGFAHDPEALKLWEASLPEDLVHADPKSIATAVTAGPAALEAR